MMTLLLSPQRFLKACGGKRNITSIDNCVTRLRLEVKDMTAVNDKVIKSAGVAGVIENGKISWRKVFLKQSSVFCGCILKTL